MAKPGFPHQGWVALRSSFLEDSSVTPFAKSYLDFPLS